uniref:Uncharacterized protein n=1 Tax=Enterobacter cloacae TaxID=550 RepID=A0A886QLZ5_ENTCL|nr:hypothetical protein JJQ61_00180 [Enterobacter cloacae]
MCENPSVKPACAIPLNLNSRARLKIKTEMKKVKSGAPDLLGLIPEPVYWQAQACGYYPVHTSPHSVNRNI